MKCEFCKDTGTRRNERPQSRFCLRYCDCAIGRRLHKAAMLPPAPPPRTLAQAIEKGRADYMRVTGQTE